MFWCAAGDHNVTDIDKSQEKREPASYATAQSTRENGGGAFSIAHHIATVRVSIPLIRYDNAGTITPYQERNRGPWRAWLDLGKPAASARCDAREGCSSLSKVGKKEWREGNG